MTIIFLVYREASPGPGSPGSADSAQLVAAAAAKFWSLLPGRTAQLLEPGRVWRVGDRARFRCPQGFMLEGVPESECQADGSWSEDWGGPACTRACSYPGATIHGTMQPVNFYYMVTIPAKIGRLTLLLISSRFGCALCTAF